MSIKKYNNYLRFYKNNRPLKFKISYCFNNQYFKINNFHQ